ncbi:unnamed protein product [Symbiodinium natans]|uniref:Acyltransferase 3 domain-containing protein n=1 Tax=Symbiodinium natans TaxID=878477 RepID=A0A812QJP4_9DINO|nr:unnamed protein product [Symbiodinium natans]
MITMFTVRWPKALQIALGIGSGLLGVYWPPASPNPWEAGTFAYQRALCLFPFYLMGQHLDISGFVQAVPAPSSARILTVWTAMMSLLYLENQPDVWKSVTFGVFEVLETDTAPFLRYPSAPGCAEDYKLLWARYFAAVAYRTFSLLVFLLFGVPRGKTWFTEAGSMTMYAYLLHAPFVRGAAMALSYLASFDIRLFGWPPLVEFAGFMALACALNLYFVGLVYALTSQPVRSVFGIFIEPTWLLRLADQMSLSPPSKKEAD